MRLPAAATTKTPSWLERGSSAIDAGDLVAAEQCFREAIKADRRNARCHFYLAIVLEARESFGDAAAHLTHALRLDPRDADAARRLSALAGRHTIAYDVELDPVGLKAALGLDYAASWIIAKLALGYLAAKGPLARALDIGRRQGWAAAGRALCLARSGELARNELFLEVLRSTTLRDADAELLLTAARRVLLLEMPDERLLGRELMTLAIAVMQQCRSNEYVWFADDEEEAHLAGLHPSLAAVLAGDVAEACKLLQLLLYRDLPRTLGACSPEALGRVRPRALREALQLMATQERDLAAAARRVAGLGGIADEVSRKVARQYEDNPYPRWTGLRRPVAGEERKLLGNFFAARELAFMDRPYEILIAGCGTGHQAVHATLSSPHARVTAVDLSARALAYGAMMAERCAAAGIEFLQADILELPAVPRFRRRYQIIECLGVLHHMADPFVGWRKLLACLAPGGKMLVGLYSATARRVITELRSDAAHPGPECDDRALRRFRQELFQRAPSALGGGLKLGPDFFTASEFRDLACHVSEQCVTVAEIARFLADNALVFRGFWMDPRQLDAFRAAYPDEPWPGRLELWEEFEAARPHTFAAMYNFWCSGA
jgi:SAM-dependent methyltransferase/tetratricopeptide (TPR) repeat protein